MDLSIFPVFVLGFQSIAPVDLEVYRVAPEPGQMCALIQNLKKVVLRSKICSEWLSTIINMYKLPWLRKERVLFLLSIQKAPDPWDLIEIPLKSPDEMEGRAGPRRTFVGWHVEYSCKLSKRECTVAHWCMLAFAEGTNMPSWACQGGILYTRTDFDL